MTTNRPHSLTNALHGSLVGGQQRVLSTGIDERAHRFDVAIRLMEDGCWQQAFTRLAELADADHPESARVALLFVRHGSRLFGGSYHASARQQRAWQRVSDVTGMSV